MLNADWMVESNQPGASLGISISDAGDVNGDGFGDVIVGALSYSATLQYEGRAYLFLGSSTGLALIPAWTFDGGQAGALLGRSVSGAGDVNGDGFDDVIIGAPDFDGSLVDDGRVFGFYGSPSGLSSCPDWVVSGTQSRAQYAHAISEAGDVNGDGFDDVIIGAWGFDKLANNQGRAYLYLGSASGLETSAAWIVDSGQCDAYFGQSLNSAGDVNGDGYADFIVGAVLYDVTPPLLPGFPSGTDEGKAFVYYGGPSGPSTTASWTAEGTTFNSYLGANVACVGDINGDGFEELVISQSSPSKSQIYYGSPTGLSAGIDLGLTNDGAVSGAGDVNGDGFDDVIVRNGGFANGESREGAVYVNLGSASGLQPAPLWISESNQVDAYLGASGSGAGDVNGDGYADVIAGAYGYDNGESAEGGAFLFHGFATPVATGALFNGTGSNPMCFSSQPPLIGGTWVSTTDNTVRPVPTFSFLTVRAGSSSGLFLSGGELLVDPSSSLFLSSFVTATGSSTTFSIQVPSDPSLVGLSATAQGIVFGSGYTCCNAYSFTVGF